MNAKPLAERSETELRAMAFAVGEALGAGPNESLSQAAFRVVRLNIAPPAVQQAARAILGCIGKPGRAQWEAIERACQLITAPPPPL